MSHTIVTELPPTLIKELMGIAERCVIKSNSISRDETPDFVQNCLLKLLMQIEQQKVIVDSETQQYYILKKNGSPIEIEPWFGTAATNISIDRYRRIKHSIDNSSNVTEIGSEENTAGSLLAPEPSIDLEEEVRESKIQEMALYCSEALDDCMDETWQYYSQEEHKNFSINFTKDAPTKNKGVAVANYCQLTLEEKYSNDGKKVNSHNAVCKSLGIVINQENIVHKKKKFEQIMIQCITKKVDSQFNETTKHMLQEGL